MANTFLRLSEWKVRGITRNPGSTAAQAHAAEGVEIVKGDLDDKGSLLASFKGATAIFSNTDFFGHLGDALISPEITKGRTPNQYAYDRQVEQSLNIARAAASTSTLETLERFVLSSLSEARKLSKGKYTKIYHNDCKAEMIQLIQDQFPALAERMNFVQVGHYVRNWQISPALRPQKQADGSFQVRRTFSPEYQMPFIVTHEDTGAFVKALVDLTPGTHLLGVSEYMTWPEWTELWGRVNGVKATFVQVSEEEYFAGMPEALKEELIDSFRYVEEFGYTGGDPDVVDPEEVSHPAPFGIMAR